MRIDKQVVISSLRELGASLGDMIGLHSNVPSVGRAPDAMVFVNILLI